MKNKINCKKNIKKKIKKSVEQFDWGKINLIDIVPEEQITPTPVLFAPGWSITIEAIQDTLVYLANCKYRVISLNHKRVGGAKYNTEEKRKAVSILAILNRKDIKVVDAVGYSEGCANILLAAQMQPEKFRNIILFNPAGLTGHERKLHLVKGFTTDLWSIGNEKENRKKRCRVIKESAKYILANPVRAYKEVVEVSNTNLIEQLSKLKDTHIKISIIHSTNDKTFDFDTVQKTINEANDKININEFYAIKGSHFDLIQSPQKSMNCVVSALQNFDIIKKDNATNFHCVDCTDKL